MHLSPLEGVENGVCGVDDTVTQILAFFAHVPKNTRSPMCTTQIHKGFPVSRIRTRVPFKGLGCRMTSSGMFKEQLMKKQEAS